MAQGDLVIVRLTMHGRHVASTMPLLAGLPPTGDAVAWDFIHISLARVGGWPPSR